jgi:hypothetical protein
MKKKYMTPDTSIVNVGTSVETMAGLELNISNSTQDDEAAKEQGEFIEEDVVPTSPNIWGDTEEED